MGSLTYYLDPIQRIRDWRRTWKQLRLMVKNRPGLYRMAQTAIQEFKAIQRKWELFELLGMVKDLKPRTVLEIGTARGGTLFCWMNLARDDATLVAVDLPPGSSAHEFPPESLALFQSWKKPAQSLFCLARDSHRPETRAEIQGHLRQEPVDFLFIDADHSYQGVRTDFEMYSPLVRPGGLIAFHDIMGNLEDPNIAVDRFWRETKGSYHSYELIDRDGFETWGGIGVLVQPDLPGS